MTTGSYAPRSTTLTTSPPAASYGYSNAVPVTGTTLTTGAHLPSASYGTTTYGAVPATTTSYTSAVPATTSYTSAVPVTTGSYNTGRVVSGGPVTTGFHTSDVRPGYQTGYTENHYNTYQHGGYYNPGTVVQDRHVATPVV